MITLNQQKPSQFKIRRTASSSSLPTAPASVINFGAGSSTPAPVDDPSTGYDNILELSYYLDEFQREQD